MDSEASDLETGVVFITLEQAQTLFNLHGQATEVAISISDIGHEASVLPALQAALPGYEVDSWKTLNRRSPRPWRPSSCLSMFLGSSWS
jgi:ABC-type lipoprotein release transport system permease subunit